MEPRRWNLVKKAVQDASDLPTADRSTYLSQICGEDDGLRAEIDSILSVSDTEAGRLSDFQFGPDYFSDLTIKSGEMLGEYTVLSLLKRGGMSVVYLGDDPRNKRPVAIKLVRRLDAERFEREPRFLAQFRHPGIATLYDTGVYKEHLAYFVLEYIDGTRIDRYCDEAALSTRKRLQVFLKVCDAVQHAHRHLVVHCDLKPSNILVTLEGQPKLLDFGIAKRLDPETWLPLTMTMPGFRRLTPAYASPEQVLGEPTTTQSDVYSLGMILYEILAGHRPYQLEGLGHQELCRVVSQDEVDRPSTAVSAREEVEGEEGTEATANPRLTDQARDEDVRRLRRALVGDVDAIVLKSLRKEPARRYASVEHLSEDIKRHLEGLPVSARKGSRSYRMGKFLRRHKVGATFFAILSFLGMISAIVIDQERREAARERRRAEQVSTFLIDLFREADPFRGGGEGLSARRMLDLASKTFENEEAVDPETRADLMGVLGQVYSHLGAYETAEKYLEGSLALRRSFFGEENQAVASSLTLLGDLHVAKEENVRAEEFYGRALKILESLRRVQALKASTIQGLALAKEAQGRLGEAERLFQQSLSITRSVHGPRSREYATASIDLGWFYYEQGEYAKAEKVYKDALSLQQELLGENHPTIADTLNHLGLLRFEQGLYEEAEQLYEQSIGMKQRFLGQDHFSVADTLLNLGMVHDERHQYDKAESLYLQAKGTYEGVFGERHVAVARVLNALAVLYKRQGKYLDAKDLGLRALKIQEDTFGPNHVQVATTLNSLGSVYGYLQSFPEALDCHKRALAIRERTLGPHHPWVATSLNNMARIYAAQGEYARAAELYKRCLDILSENLEPTHPNIASALTNLAACYIELGELSEAKHLLARALKIREDRFGPDHVEVAYTLNQLGRLLRGLQEYGQAERTLGRALSNVEETLGSDHPLVIELSENLAGLREETGKTEDEGD